MNHCCPNLCLSVCLSIPFGFSRSSFSSFGGTLYRNSALTQLNLYPVHSNPLQPRLPPIPTDNRPSGAEG
eukprot:jgi/Psemu1/316031/fgenesh1_kg.2697_\